MIFSTQLLSSAIIRDRRRESGHRWSLEHAHATPANSSIVDHKTILILVSDR